MSHKTFLQYYNDLLKFIEENNKLPSSSSKNINEKKLGNWAYRIRKSYLKKTLDKNNIDLLEKINIWYWNKKIYMKNKYLNFIKVNNRIPCNNSPNNELKLYYWYKKNKEMIDINNITINKKNINININI
jgi:hypothetical protein